MHVIQHNKFTNRNMYQLHNRVTKMTPPIREGSHLSDLNRQAVQTRAIRGKKDILLFLQVLTEGNGGSFSSWGCSPLKRNSLLAPEMRM